MMRRTEVTRTEVVEVVDVNKPSKGKQVDMFRHLRYWMYKVLSE